MVIPANIVSPSDATSITKTWYHMTMALAEVVIAYKFNIVYIIGVDKEFLDT